MGNPFFPVYRQYWEATEYPRKRNKAAPALLLRSLCEIAWEGKTPKEVLQELPESMGPLRPVFYTGMDPLIYSFGVYDRLRDLRHGLKDWFPLYRRHWEAVRDLPDSVVAQWFQSVCEYAFEGKHPEKPGPEAPVNRKLLWSILALSLPDIRPSPVRKAAGSAPRQEADPGEGQSGS